MKKILFLLCILCSLNFSYAQYKNTMWCFGDSAGIDFSNLSNPVTFTSSLDTRGSAVSISDSLNNLLMYANTRAATNTESGLIWSRNNQLCINGDSIYGEGWYKEMILIPYPDDDSVFYLFHSNVVGNGMRQGLFYSLIRIDNNPTLDSVIQKNIQLDSFQVADGLAAIKHGNGRDWWLLAKRWDIPNNNFLLKLITPSGIISSIQSIGPVVANAGFFRIEPSWDGTKIACTFPQGMIEVYQFDRCSGIISNPVIVDTVRTVGNPPNYWSCELSFDKSKLYAMSILQGSIQDTSYLLQFDMNAPNIYASRDTIHIFNTPTQPGAIELAPDGKMYIASTYEWGGFPFPYPDSVHNVYNENLSVINFPDSLDASCNFQPFSFYLGGNRTYYGLPNNPNYELGAWIGSSCDTLGVGVEELTIKSEAELFVTFISEWDKLFINAKRLKGKDCLLWVFDVNGKIIFSSEKKSEPPYFTMDVNCASFAKGMYIVRLQTEKEILTKKFIIN